MVTILPPKVDAGQLVGQGLGQGLGQGIARGAEIGFQRNLVRNSLQPLKNLPPDTTPAQLASYIIEATAGIPGGEKYAGTLFQTLLPTLQSQQKAKPATEEILSSLEPRAGQEGQQLDFNTQVKQSLGEKFFPNIQPHEPIKGTESLKPLKPLVPPSPIGPSEESKIRRLLIDRGITDPTVQDDQINKLKQYQADVYTAQKEGFGNLQAYQEARRERDNLFFQETLPALENAHGTMSPTQNALWKEMSRKYEDLPSPARFASTEQDFNALVSDPLTSFRSNQKGLPFASVDRPQEVKKRLNDARTSIQDHLRRIEERRDIPKELKGIIKNELRDEYKTSLLEKDFGVAQAAYATRDLSEKFSKSIPKVPHPPSFIYKIPEKYIYDLANHLITNLEPEDSLVRARDEAISNNYDDQSFNQAFNLAINSGRLKLSDVQAKERNDLSIPQQLDLDSILEGYRSYKDMFKGKK